MTFKFFIGEIFVNYAIVIFVLFNKNKGERSAEIGDLRSNEVETPFEERKSETCIATPYGRCETSARFQRALIHIKHILK